MNTRMDTIRWIQKAMAFVTRSHRHLWGKNNEDPLAFLFEQGLKNSVAKKMLMGWNKFGQNRPIDNWGLKPQISDDEKTDPVKLYLPAGIVIPYIIEKKLCSVFIQPFYENDKNPLTIAPLVMVPGSMAPTLVLGSPDSHSLVVIQNLLHGLFLYQETEEKICIIIHPDAGQPIKPDICTMIQAHRRTVILSSTQSGHPNFLPDTLKPHSQIVFQYENKKDLLNIEF